MGYNKLLNSIDILAHRIGITLLNFYLEYQFHNFKQPMVLSYLQFYWF